MKYALVFATVAALASPALAEEVGVGVGVGRSVLASQLAKPAIMTVTAIGL